MLIGYSKRMGAISIHSLRIKRTKIKQIWATLLQCLFIYLLLLPSSDMTLGSNRETVVAIVRVLACLYACYRNKWKLSYYSGLLVFFELEFIFSALINRNSPAVFMMNAFRVLPVIMYTEIGMKRNSKQFLKSCEVVLCIFATIHFLDRLFENVRSVNIYTNPVYYLGNDNQATSYLLLLLTICLLYISLYKVNIVSLYGVAIAILISIYSSCGTALMTYCIMAALFLWHIIPTRTQINRSSSQFSFYAIIYCIFHLFIYSRIILEESTLLSNVIALITGKSAEFVTTFTGRTKLWGLAFLQIFNHPILGMGYPSDGTGIVMWGNSLGAHNQILQWGVYGGLVSVVICYTIIVYVSLKVDKLPQKAKTTAFICLLGYMIAMSMELYFQGIHFFMILSVLYGLCRSERNMCEPALQHKHSALKVNT